MDLWTTKILKNIAQLGKLKIAFFYLDLDLAV